MADLYGCQGTSSILGDPQVGIWFSPTSQHVPLSSVVQTSDSSHPINSEASVGIIRQQTLFSTGVDKL